MPRIFFTADNHFNHANIIKHENRPFIDVDDMNEKMIRIWNRIIGEEDDVYILGDFVWGSHSSIVPQLNGKKYLIKGNHDKQVNNRYFEWAKDYYVLKYKDLKFILFHYPIFRWDKCHYGSYHLYGHVHSNNKTNEFMNSFGNCYNVGVDVNNYRPVEIEEVILRIRD